MTDFILRQSQPALSRSLLVSIPSDLANAMREAIVELSEQGEIRITEDGRFSIFDVIECAALKGNPRDSWKKLCERNPEVVDKADNYQFEGKGQRPTPVIDLPGCLEIIWLLPGEIAQKMRRIGAEVNARVAKQAIEDNEFMNDPLLVSLQAVSEVRLRQLKLEKAQAELERRLNESEQQKMQARQELLALPSSSRSVPPETTEMKIRRIVNTYCSASGAVQGEAWRTLYQQHYYRYQRRVKPLAKESKIKAFIRLGLIDSLYDLALELFKPSSETSAK